MSDHTRRRFLALAGAGAAAVGVGVTAAEPAQAKPAKVPSGATGPLVAYVTDVRSGAVSVMVGDREVVLHDRDLVARLARAAF
jgi:hypothetical protein